ncbi:hypothetical protein GCM10028786_32020 [Flaviaesturariibacter terrae]
MEAGHRLCYNTATMQDPVARAYADEATGRTITDAVAGFGHLQQATSASTEALKPGRKKKVF